jgi:hypothetical protein
MMPSEILDGRGRESRCSMSDVTRETITEIEQLADNGISKTEISKLVGKSLRIVRLILSGEHQLQVDFKRPSRAALIRRSRDAVIAVVGERTVLQRYKGRTISFVPTPEQIEAACLAIRETWADTDYQKRRWGTADAQTAW